MSVILRGEEIKLCSRPSNGYVRRVLATNDVTVEPRGVSDCPVRFPHKSLQRSGCDWLIECDRLPSDVAACRVVVDDNMTQSTVRLVNASSERVTVKRGECIGRGVEAVAYSPTGLESEPREEPAGIALIPGRDDVQMTQDGVEGCVPPAVQPRAGWEHTQPLIDGLPPELTPCERAKAIELIRAYAHVFSKDDFDIGRTNLISHEVNTGSAKPVKQTLRRHPLQHLPLIDQFVDELLAKGLVEKSRSAWSSNVVLARKKSASDPKSFDIKAFRFCVDLRGVNDVIISDAYCAPKIESCLESFGGAKYFCILDSMSAYHMVPLANEESKNRTAFITRKGLFQYKYLPFGEKNACATYSRLMDLVLAGLQFEIALCYLDDIVIFGKTFDETCDRLRIVLERIESAGIKLKVSKSRLLQKSIVFLSFLISEDGIRPDPNKVSSITNWPVLNNLTETRAFVGVCAYYRKFIKDFAGLARPLYDLTKKHVPFVWGPSQNDAFVKLKNCLVSAPILASPLSDGNWKVETDASGQIVAAILYQEQENEWRVIAYASRVLNKAETTYCSSKIELLAVVFALKQFRHFLLGRKFEIVVDNSSLQYLLKSQMLTNMEARYLCLISEFDFAIKRVPGRSHLAVDGLSRKPCSRDDVTTMCDKCKPRLRVIKRRKSRSSANSDRNVTVSNESSSVEGGVGNTIDAATSDVSPAAGWRSEVGSRVSAPRSPRRPVDRRVPTESDVIVVDDGLLRSAQQSDDSIKCIVDLLNSGGECEWADVNKANAESRVLFSQRHTLVVRDGILYRKYVNAECEVLCLQVVVPYQLRKKYLETVHGSRLAGHLGVAKTRYRLQRIAYWVGWVKDVKLFVRCCAKCNGARKGLFERHGPLRYASTTGNFNKLHIDLVGPFVKSRSGFMYILTAVCSFSKYLIAVPLRNKTCFTVARELVRKVYLIFGPSELCVHDGGMEFCNELLFAINSLLGIQSAKVTCYRPSGNAVVERVHATLHKLFATTVDRDQRNWDEALPFVNFAYNTARHETTAFTPFYLMFMREANIGVDLVSDVKLNVFEGPVAEYVALMRDRMHDAYALVCDGMKTSFEKAKRRYDPRVKSCRFEAGQKVWYFCPRRRSGLSYKWSLATTGPYEIVKKINDANFVIRLSTRHRSFVVNIDRLRAYTDFDSAASSTAAKRKLGGESVLPVDGDEDTPRPSGVPRPRRQIKRPTRLIED